jgi:ABC-2 type transport system ATP-binding protein
MNEQPVISTRGLTRYFGRKAAVYDLTLAVPRGSVFGFLGRNGSGKTTAIRMLLGLVQPTRGEGQILGYDIRALPPEARARIGYLTEEHQLYGWMKVRECAEFQSQFYPRWNDKVFRGVIGHFALRPDAKVKELSRGERAGLCLGLTLAPEPELLILDDPALGLDPVARRSLVESMIYLTRRSNRTIFFSSHDLADVERVADHIAVLDRSVLRACCSLETFRNSVQQVRLRFPGTPPPLPPVPGLLQAVRAEGELRLTCVRYNGPTEKLLRALNPTQLEAVPINLEDAFISYLGERGEKSFILSETEGRGAGLESVEPLSR